MTRTSPAEVRGMFARVVEAADGAGIDCSLWTLRLPDGGVACSIRDERAGLLALDFRTLREASLTLSGMERAFLLVPAREEVR